jgi:hypothetical protein
MATSMAALRAKLKAEEEKTSAQGKGGSAGGKDNSIYPFWNIPTGSTAVLRFLPDLDETNEYFWRERQIINIGFAGTKGGDINKPVNVKVPCVEMWNESCPIHAAIRPWFKDPRMEDMARKYWKKRSYIFNGFVQTNPLADDVSESPIRKFIINTSIFGIIKSALINPEMDELPTDFIQGTDFRLVKTTKGEYADYTTSAWARKERSLNEQELEAIAQYGLYNLNDFMPKKPNAEELNAIVEMFEASVDGELYDPARWAQFYKPSGFRDESVGTTAGTTNGYSAPAARVAAPQAAQKTAPAPTMESYDDPSYGVEESAPVQAAAPAAGKPNVDDLLSMIRNRKTA